MVFDDYSLPNKALSAGDIELNAFQHLVFLAQSNTENKTDIASIAATTVVPLGLYSSKHKQLADLPDRAEIALPNDPANQGRGLRVLIFDQIRALAATGQTIIFITHRLHSVRHADVIHVMKDGRHADVIHVMKDGRLAESGTFSELMDEATGTGDFRDSYLIQASAFAESVPAQRAPAADTRAEEHS
ncbi:MetQ/NlpA family ABC transporter substrate-binding protein [Streptomyces sp. NPDC058289]|uniref:MetQ/NlpA family ABC transporter substrate-binding protein n=1 Tax=Streptomyces sp. NPDC058289 TaxID=3346425 RepID=UPI0036E8F8F6